MIYVPLPFACMPKLSTYSILDKSEKNGKLYLNFLLLSLHECCTKCHFSQYFLILDNFCYMIYPQK